MDYVYRSPLSIIKTVNSSSYLRTSAYVVTYRQLSLASCRPAEAE